MNILRKLVALCPALRLGLAKVAVVLLGIAMAYAVQAISLARAVAAIMSGEYSRIAGPLAVLVTALAVRALLIAQRGRVALRVTGPVCARLRAALATKLLELGPGWTSTRRTGELQAKLVDSVEAVDPFLARLIPQYIVTPLAAAGMAAFVIAIDPLVGLVVLACAVTAPLVPLLSWRFVRAPTERWQRGYRALYADNLDAIQGMTSLKVLGASGRRNEQLSQQALEFCRTSTKVILLWGPALGLVAFLAATGSALAVALGALHHVTGRISSEGLLMVLLLSRECFRSIRDLEGAYHDSWSFRADAPELFALLETEPSVRDGKEGLSTRCSNEFALKFENVSFSYETNSRRALDGFELSAAAGERVALVGRSGAGKSTVVSLLMRFFDPSEGRIWIGDRDVRELELKGLRRSIAVVSQHSYLFHGTLRDNLLLGRPGATEAQLREAARAAQIHRFVDRLPHGYDSRIGERGLTLSGGERQRIAIARALLQDAPILVLDEATSSVDGENEFEIQSALKRLSQGRLTLMIAHRLSSVRDFDRVILMDAGQIVEQGSHEGLMAQGGAYARLAAAQGVSPLAAHAVTGVR